MYLKRLEIQGFKSFANHTVLDFLPPKNGHFSITAVVGPNGSGKSNVTDAIRWVMGETSMKTIRSKKSEDVIFNGSEAKGALSAAEVTMVLDNTGDSAEIGTEDVVVVRRLYRSGESEYLINNSSARLLDIHLLMAKAQFAEHAYSIVSQGMIDRLLTVTNAERKEFFDEASGIKEMYIKRHQAFLKLERTKEHVTQAETIIQEIEPRLKLLARQVKKLEEREEVETQLREVQEQYYFTIYSKNKADIDVVESKVHLLEEQYRTNFKTLEQVQSELAELARVSSRQEIFDALQVEHQAHMQTKNTLDRELAILEGQMHTEYSQAGKQNINWLNEKVIELKQSREKLNNELTILQTELGSLQTLLSQHKKQLEELHVSKSQLTLKISRLQNELLKDQSEQHYRDFSGLTAVKAVLDHKRQFGEIYGLVAELGEVDEEYRVALEVTAGMHLTSIVVNHEEVARKAIEYLRQERYGIATFLPLNKIQGRYISREEEELLQNTGVIGLALELVRFDEKFRNIFSFIFGGTLVVKDLMAAQNVGIGRARMVTLTGDLAEKNGAMRGGFRQKRQQISFSSKLNFHSEDRLDEYRKDIAVEQEMLRELEKNEEHIKQGLLKNQVERETISSKINLLEQQKNNFDTELAKLERECAMLQSSPEEFGAQLEKLSIHKQELEVRMAEVQKEVRAAALRIKQFNEDEEQKKQRVFALQEQMQKAQTEVNAILSEREGYKVSLAKLETKQEDLSQEVYNDMNMSITSIVERVAMPAPLEQLDTLADQIQKLKYKLSLIGGIDAEVTKEHSETKERFDFLSNQLTDLSKAMKDLTSMIEELDELMKKKRAEAFKKIRKEFNRYFQMLFEGGHADLEEVYGEESEKDENVEMIHESSLSEDNNKQSKKDKILTGIEIIANPPGKKIKYLNALSGGERTLTSIALICAILHHNPSPFVVLDEVEAALDETNTQRFVRIMKELSEQSQFILITHNRVTMHAADALYGVVMGGDGVSKLLSVKLEDVGVYEAVGSVDKKPST